MNSFNRLSLFAVLLAVPLLMGPAADVPEKIAAAQTFWDTNQQSIEIGIDLHNSLLRSDDYVVGSRVMMIDRDGNPLADIVTLHPIITRGTGRDIEVAPLRVPWDRNEGTFTGTSCVCVMLQVFDRQGRLVRNAFAEFCDVVEIR